VGKHNVDKELYQKIEKFLKITGLFLSKYIVLKVPWDLANKIRGCEWLDAGLPTPTFIIWTKSAYYLGYAINGSIRTSEQKKFFKDLGLRLKFTLELQSNAKNVKISNLYMLTFLEKEDIIRIDNNKIRYEMKTLASYCISLTPDLIIKEKEKVKEFNIFARTYTKSEDALFDFIRFKVYDYIRVNFSNKEKDKWNIYDYTMEIALLAYSELGSKKGISSIICKARNIAEWCYKNYNPSVNNWNYVRKTKNDEELKVTRKEKARENAKLKYDRVHKKVMSLITGMFANEYKKKNGDWNISKIAKEAGVTRSSVYKHLKDENLI
jgi:hypothetical protein